MKINKLLDRDVVLKSLVGSHNYNLNTPESDRDYKVYVTPTFEELYNNKRFAESIVNHTDGNDYDIHDIRKLPELLFKANLNYLETFYSKDLIVDARELNEIFNRRNEVFNINLPQLFKSCGGTFLQKMKQLPKGTEGTQHLVDKFGYDTKQAQHAYRNLHFCVKYAETDFKDVEYALRYDGEDLEFMMEIKNGHFTQENFERFVYFYHDSRFVHIKEQYLAQPVNIELKEHVDNQIMKLVKRNLK